MTKAKPYAISKQIVWEAYKRVKANRGAAGVDGQSLADFEKDLKNNLFKLWNRMSSGSYFPPCTAKTMIDAVTMNIPSSTFSVTRSVHVEPRTAGGNYLSASSRECAPKRRTPSAKRFDRGGSEQVVTTKVSKRLLNS